MDPIPHLFRTEYSKIVAVLCKHFGFDRLEVAEDIASETFLTALNTWPYQGVPDNPTAWLFTVAKNKARNAALRSKTFVDKVVPEIKDASHFTVPTDDDLSLENVFDNQLRMLFTICDPSLSPQSQIALALRVLCGFGVDEIANALLMNRETVTKRLLRAKQKLREARASMEFPAIEKIPERLNTVLTTLYLLFNEGYYSESHESIVREELCVEAMRLCNLLIEYPLTNRPACKALLSLMCFQASRLKARKDSSGGIVLYDDQDDAMWDKFLIARGAELLKDSATGDEVSRYHIEAQIAYWYTRKEDHSKWEKILQLYNHLLTLEYSPIAALNRTFALSKVKGPDIAIEQAEKLGLHNNRYYDLLLAELYKERDPSRSENLLRAALNLAKTSTEKKLIQLKLTKLKNRIS